MEDSEFKKLIDRAIDSLPQEFLEKLENVSIVIEDWPTHHQRKNLAKKGQGGLILGLYEGIPQTRRGRYGVGPTLPDKITIFKIPILMISKTYDQLVENIRKTVIHEIAHHFGLEEEEIARSKLGRK